jgi:hypothetical protein
VGMRVVAQKMPTVKLFALPHHHDACEAMLAAPAHDDHPNVTRSAVRSLIRIRSCAHASLTLSNRLHKQEGLCVGRHKPRRGGTAAR